MRYKGLLTDLQGLVCVTSSSAVLGWMLSYYSLSLSSLDSLIADLYYFLQLLKDGLTESETKLKTAPFL